MNFGGYDLGDCELITGISEFGDYQSLEIAVLEVTSFGGYGLGVFNTHPISMTSRTGVDTVIQRSCSMCITRFHQNIQQNLK